ncbi:MAG: phosphatase PAP2 family protein [Bacteroidetes bacterium]|nr:phosphatase PAP2 family protein [Bacteroidota bacterium]
MEKIEQLDRWLFKQINSTGANAFFDWLLPSWRTPTFWIPAYLLLLVVLVYRFRQKAGWWVLFLITTVGLVDLIGNQLIKQTIQRLRPCNDPSLAGEVLLRIPACGTGFSFISNHAANHFAIATFMFLTLGKWLGRTSYFLFLWAFLVGYAQIYVGVHYPGDVLAGSIMGIAIAAFMASLYSKQPRFGIFDSANLI